MQFPQLLMHGQPSGTFLLLQTLGPGQSCRRARCMWYRYADSCPAGSITQEAAEEPNSQCRVQAEEYNFKFTTHGNKHTPHA